MNRGYKKYHSDVKLSFSLEIENKILPFYFLKQIPNSTSHYWKYENADKYLGSEFATNIRDALDDTKAILDN